MRTIKFRIYNKRTKSWIHGPHSDNALDGINLIGENILLGNFLNETSVKDYNELEVLQFTGMQDKKGKDIFEGDIIEVYRLNMRKEILPVNFDSELGMFIAGNRNLYWDSLFLELDYGTVIGNMFDNPELLQ